SRRPPRLRGRRSSDPRTTRAMRESQQKKVRPTLHEIADESWGPFELTQGYEHPVARNGCFRALDDHISIHAELVSSIDARELASRRHSSGTLESQLFA